MTAANDTRKTAAACIRLSAVAGEFQFVTASQDSDRRKGFVTASKIRLANMLDSSSHGNALESRVGHRQRTGNRRAGRLQPASREVSSSRLHWIFKREQKI